MPLAKGQKEHRLCRSSCLLIARRGRTKRVRQPIYRMFGTGHLTRHAINLGAACGCMSGTSIGGPVNRFVYEQNLRHLREVLARTADEAERRRIVSLIEREEEENTKKPDDRLHA